MRSAKDEIAGGYLGKLLRIDLTKHAVSVEAVAQEKLRLYGGGVGYAARWLYDEMPVGVEPLGPDSKVVFATGPFTGTLAPGSGSTEICFKSPLTGVWCETRAGGEWGGSLKKAGYDFLAIEGRSDEPVYILVQDRKVELRPAAALSGRTTSEKQRMVREEVGDLPLETVAIGPAGERLVRFANVMAGERAFGRGGAGAVLGAKNVLAIAVTGSGEIPVARPRDFSDACKRGNQKVLSETGGKGWARHGTTRGLVACDEQGDLPTKNWRSNSWGKGRDLYGRFRQNNLVRGDRCYKGCVMRCKRIVRVPSGRWKTPQHEGGEYESMASFTFFVLSEDIDAAVHADYLCNEYGLDTISTGAVIGFALDCWDSGIIDGRDTDGLPLTWGDAETVVRLVHMINGREGLGRVLGEGVRRASQEFGRGAESLAVHVKGLEGPAHDPRSGKTLASSYATANRGMCHIHPLETSEYDSLKNDFGLLPYGIPDPATLDRFAEVGKGPIVKTLQDFGIVPDILGFCKFYIFAGLGLDEIAPILASLTGWDVDGRDLLAMGERVFDLQRMFNVREGIGRGDDALPQRCRSRPEFGAYATVRECEIRDFEAMLDEYYEARGWDRHTGAPTRAGGD